MFYIVLTAISHIPCDFWQGSAQSAVNFSG